MRVESKGSLVGILGLSALSWPLHFFFSSHPVIGRGGEQINKIQQDSGCKVQISPGMALAGWVLPRLAHSTATKSDRHHSGWNPPVLYIFLVFISFVFGGVHLPQYTLGQRSVLVRVIRACAASWLFLSDGVQILNSGHRGW